MTDIRVHSFDSGLVLATERNRSVASAAVSIKLPLGSARDPHDRVGAAAILEELLLRGSRSMTSREQSDAFDALGVSRSTSTTTFHTTIHATALGDRLDEAIPLLADMVRAPRLADDGFEASRELCLSAARAIAEDPQELVTIKLREHHAPSPLNRSHLGTIDGLENCDAAHLREHYAAFAAPGGCIIAVAGDIEHDRVRDRVGGCLDDWSVAGNAAPTADAEPRRGYHHVDQDTNQTHVAVAYDAPAERDDRAVLERLAVAVLSGGMSGRLFTEVREKRGLCYAVQASYSTSKDFGRTTAYVGSTPDRAQESFDVLFDEIRGLGVRDGAVTPDEFRRAKTGLKSRLVMSGESTRARAQALGNDLFRIGRARSLDEVGSAIDGVSLDELNGYLADRSFGEVTIVSVGPAPLAVAERV